MLTIRARRDFDCTMGECHDQRKLSLNRSTCWTAGPLALPYPGRLRNALENQGSVLVCYGPRRFRSRVCGGRQRIVPVPVELVASERKCSDFLGADLNPGLVVVPVPLRFYLEPTPGLGGRDQLADDPQRASTEVRVVPSSLLWHRISLRDVSAERGMALKTTASEG